MGTRVRIGKHRSIIAAESRGRLVRYPQAAAVVAVAAKRAPAPVTAASPYPRDTALYTMGKMLPPFQPKARHRSVVSSLVTAVRKSRVTGSYCQVAVRGSRRPPPLNRLSRFQSPIRETKAPAVRQDSTRFLARGWARALAPLANS